MVAFGRVNQLFFGGGHPLVNSTVSGCPEAYSHREIIANAHGHMVHPPSARLCVDNYHSVDVEYKASIPIFCSFRSQQETTK